VHLVEGFRGRRAWAAYESEARAKGVKLDLMEYVSPAIPDAENYAAIPLFQETFSVADGATPAPNPLAFPKPDIVSPNWGDLSKAQARDLTKFRDYFVTIGLLKEASEDVPGDVLRALEAYEPYIDQVRRASARPRTRFPVQWEQGFAARLPHLPILRTLSKHFSLMGSAHLAKNDSAAAYEDLRQGLRICDALRSEPVLINGLVLTATIGIASHSVWDGLVADRWADAELAKLTDEFLAMNLLDDLTHSVNSERGGMNFQLDATMEMPNVDVANLLMATSSGVSTSGVPIGARLAVLSYPRGWVRQNQVLINQLMDEWMTRIARMQREGYPGALRDEGGLRKLTNAGGFQRIYYFLAQMVMPALSPVESSFLKADVRVKQTAIACALQRYRHAKNTFPEALDELVPEQLIAIPRDIFSNRPMCYRKDAMDRYTLWSVGSNQKDDGGMTDSKHTDKELADLVWPSGTAESGK
jgi:hypothetical protein